VEFVFGEHSGEYRKLIGSHALFDRTRWMDRSGHADLACNDARRCGRIAGDNNDLHAQTAKFGDATGGVRARGIAESDQSGQAHGLVRANGNAENPVTPQLEIGRNRRRRR
jgi:hypothetical protein